MANRRPFRTPGSRSNSPPPARRPRHGAGTHSPPSRGKPRDAGRARHEAGAQPRPQSGPVEREPGKLERLQKVLAHAGLGSRRACEELILQGRVSVDGQVVRQLGTRVDAAIARIMVDAEPIRLETTVYYAVNKPKGYVSTNFDPSGRPRVVDLLPEIPERVYTVGRLDEDSTGLMILTNDGELANKLAHPRYGVEKIYRALVAGLPGPEMVAKLTEGIWLSDGKVRAKRARIVGRQGQATQLELVLAEGKKREIRRMLSKLGHKVMSLTRIAMGPVTLKGLPTGNCRPLSRHEVDLLRKVAAGIAISTPRSMKGDRPDTPRSSHSHGSNRPRREQADRSPPPKSAARHGAGPRRFRDNAGPAGAKPGHSQGRRTPPSAHVPRAVQQGRRNPPSEHVPEADHQGRRNPPSAHVPRAVQQGRQNPPSEHLPRADHQGRRNPPSEHVPRGVQQGRRNPPSEHVPRADHQGRQNLPSEHVPAADQSGPRRKRAIGSGGGPPGQAGGPKRPASSAPPATQPPRSRRIIGLEPEPPAGGRKGTRGKGRSIPKRPPARKPSLRRPGQRPLRSAPAKANEIEGEDA
ncbi:MAG: pseudouridine synthase [Isosphaeraceae bacterium]